MRSEEGMTLVEVMVAVVIISVGLVAILGMFIFGMQTSAKSAEDTVALLLAQKKIEEAKYLLNSGISPAAQLTSFPEPEYAAYQYWVEVEEDSDLTNTYKLTVAVVYGPKSIQLQTRLRIKA
jgi:prepilin-type N-terminal cleavage/methylation domain-containing protein